MKYSTDLFIDIVILISIFVGVFIIDYFIYKGNDRNGINGMTNKEVSILRHHLYIAAKNYYLSTTRNITAKDIMTDYIVYQAIKDLTKDLLQKEPIGLTAMLSDIDEEAKREVKISMYKKQDMIL